MTSSKAWNGVTEAIFDCIKATSEKDHGTKYDPPHGDQGTSTTDTAVGTVVLGFSLANGTLTYTIQKKPWIVPESSIWEGIGDTINGCR